MDVNDQDASICRICFRGTSAGYLLQPCSCRGSIGFSHRPCIEQWVKDRKEEVCNICRHRYPIEKKMKHGSGLDAQVLDHFHLEAKAHQRNCSGLRVLHVGRVSQCGFQAGFGEQYALAPRECRYSSSLAIVSTATLPNHQP
ncbi:uncharacterized protein LOC135400071 isoform X2 [Ornithodoros turicata]|uniref:uncharacterized protein LOC135400071 isoform X2 n=1 Tax=Ornithodoros turicata TaxID=34597 RepID=UPI00313944DB